MTDLEPTDLEAIDYFTNPAVGSDPFPYFRKLREQGPVVRLPHHGVVAVLGYDEAIEVYRDHETFSSCIAVAGPFPPLPFQPEGDDLGPLIDQHRAGMPMGEYLITQDPPVHSGLRGLMMKLFTPNRLKENEAFMWRLADQLIDGFIDDGRLEVLRGLAAPFATLVIADLLGVPEKDHREFRKLMGGTGELADAELAAGAREVNADPLAVLSDWFTSYVEDRRREPRSDVLTAVSNATLPDGSLPPVADVVRTATFLFAAGQDTTARLLSSALRLLGERPDLQKFVRADAKRIANFIEEVLRLEGPVKNTFRLARRATRIGDVEIPVGTVVMLSMIGVNRDPRRFEDPDEFRPDRRNAREHLSFGRGVHACIGGPLARVEARVCLDRLLARTGEIRLDEAHHGPAGAHRFAYEPTYILRALKELHVEFTPA